MDTQSATLPPYILPTEGKPGGGVSVYHLHTPFNPNPPQHEVGPNESPQVYTSGGSAHGGPNPEPPTKIYRSPDSDMLGRTAGKTTCTSCQQDVTTNVTYKPGTYAVLMCLLFICCGLFLCCCLIPFFMKDFKDAYHTCPRCNRVLHVEKKKCCSSG
ncbi:lipopolysaccharide-induced tumor necrosis factor-alpha factor homolog-like [Gadus chalcogrammus]|uniref:lipopolysaccharide-induced tumor necrosis factor-alpha factor homolog-like n=1 Tax=Gadus chalcogrammus TaxID=1042646 RepID=UPI0024C418A9|nr:lipopolysaccharide-induced tumor necrosis factor-alpha factor homolog-like [Gadus chalcogrammus]